MPRYPTPDAELAGPRKLAFGWTALPRAGNPAPAPRLPAKAPGGRAWHAGVRPYWRTLWSSPQSTQWQRADPSLFRLVAFEDRRLRGECTVGELAEMRFIEDRHGLSGPKSLLQLRWKIVEAEEPAEPTPRGKARKRYGHLAPVGDPK